MRRTALLASVCLGALLAAAVGSVAVRPAVAWADPPSGTKDCSGADDTPPAGGGTTGATTTTTIPGEDGDGGVCSSLLDAIAPGDNVGPHPTANYDIGYDQGGTCICASRRITGWTTAAVFGAETWVVRVGLGIINWALQFHFARMLMGPAQDVSNAYQRNVVDRMGLGPLFLFIAALWAGLLALAGKSGRGLAELGVSLVIASLAATVLANPGAQMRRGLDFTAGVGSDIAAVSSGVEPSSNTKEGELARPMLRSIHKSFVETPWELISWGRTIPPGDKCYDVVQAIVANGPWGTSTRPRKVLNYSGCKAEAKFNHDPSMDRLVAALLVLVAAVMVVVLLVMVAATLIAAQLGILLALVLWPFAAVFGTLPGRGRALFWRWVGQTGMEFAKVVVMMMLLSLTLVGVAATLSATETEKLVPQMGLVCLVIVVALAKRKQFVSGARRAVGQWTSRMAGGRVGPSGGGWLQPGLAGLGAGTLAARGRHTLRAHQTAQRERAMVSLGRQGNAQAATFHDQRMAYDMRSQSHVQNIVFVMSGGPGADGASARPHYAGARPEALPEPRPAPEPVPLERPRAELLR